MKLWHDIRARKDLENSFHRYEGPVKLVRPSLTVRKRKFSELCRSCEAHACLLVYEKER